MTKESLRQILERVACSKLSPEKASQQISGFHFEDLGFAKPGEGVKLIEDKETYIGGKTPVNVDGGLLCKGHPIGATGGSQIRTIVRQLRGEAGEVQVEGAKVGLVHNVGGVGTYGNVTILRR